jgi:anthranilate synthase component 1
LRESRDSAFVTLPEPVAADAHGRIDLDPLALIARWPDRYPAFLESSAQAPATGTSDLLPIADGRFIALGRDGMVRDETARAIGTDFAGVLDAAWRHERTLRQSTANGDDGALFCGGWVLYLGYEAVAQFEPVLSLPAFDAADLPVALAVRAPAAFLRDRSTGRARLVCEQGYGNLLDQARLDAACLTDSAQATENDPVLNSVAEDDPARFLCGVEKILDYLRAGDVFQVNLSRGWEAQFDAPPDVAALYRRLRSLSPAPFSGLLRWRGAAVISASPERLLRVRGRRIDTRPIAGTRPRGRDARADDALRAELIAHPKERAEHVMLIDLERNDLGRICVPGSIAVDELMTLETYAQVHHIVSNVSGELRADTTPGAILRALFPGGTITGCPKVRCMEIIAEIEGIGRGPYTGAMGYLGLDGDMDLNILIRSAWVQGTRLGFRTGAGIVADSIAERELAETRAKAGGMLALLAGLGPGRS